MAARMLTMPTMWVGAVCFVVSCVGSIAVAPQPTATPIPTPKSVPAAAPEPTVVPDPNPHRALLDGLAAGTEPTLIPYARNDWDPLDCRQFRRYRVLAAASLIPVAHAADGCTITTGRWTDPWTGQTLTRADQMGVDRVVSLRTAHAAGGHAWAAERRHQFAADPLNLRAVADRTRLSRAVRVPNEWQPPLGAARCTYAQAWITVKHKYGLSATAAERSALAAMLDICDEPQSQAQVAGEVPALRCTDFHTAEQYATFYAGRMPPRSHDRDRDGRYCEALD